MTNVTELHSLQNRYRAEYGYEFDYNTFRNLPCYILNRKHYDRYVSLAVKSCNVNCSVWSEATKVTVDDGRLRHFVICRDSLKLAPDPFDGALKAMLPQEFAMLTLKWLYGQALTSRDGGGKWGSPLVYGGLRQYDGIIDHELMQINPPSFFSGMYKDRVLVYFDIVSAYAILYERLSLDMEFNRGIGQLGLAPARQMTEFANVPDDKKNEFKKFARNSVIGLIASRHSKRYKGGKSVVQFIPKLFWSPNLWATVQCILHEIANFAVKCGAIYVGTDCYIFPVRTIWAEFEQYLNSYGLGYRRHIGHGSIYGWQTYDLTYPNSDGEMITMLKNNDIIKMWSSPKVYHKFAVAVASRKDPSNLRVDLGIGEKKWVDWWSRLKLAEYTRVEPEPDEPDDSPQMRLL